MEDQESDRWWIELPMGNKIGPFASKDELVAKAIELRFTSDSIAFYSCWSSRIVKKVGSMKYCAREMLAAGTLCNLLGDTNER